MSAAPHVHDASGGFRRFLKNVGWLIGGKGFGAICSLFYLAVLSRSLGIKDFGHFSLIFGTGLALVELSSFQTWQIIVRYGAPLISLGEKIRFARLAVLGFAIDIGGAVFGCLLAGIAIYGFSQALDLNPNYIDTAFAFICALLFARVSAPMGVLRAHDRYGLAVSIGAITPVARLIAAFVIWETGPTVERFLFAWAAIELASAAMFWIAAWRQVPQHLRPARILEARQTISENPGIRKFAWMTYFNATSNAILQHSPLLAVGFFLGTSGAGVYRFADQFAKGLSKLSTMMLQAIYPEISRQRELATGNQFWSLVRRVMIMVSITGIIATIIAIALGETLLGLLGGDEFAQSGAILVPLALAASFGLGTVAFEPVLHSVGKVAWSFYARIIAIVALACGIAMLMVLGPIGIGWAVTAAYFCGSLAMGLIVWRIVRSEKLMG